jgi:hypothetical protein
MHEDWPTPDSIEKEFSKEIEKVIEDELKKWGVR